MQDRIEIFRRLERQYIRDRLEQRGLLPMEGMVLRLLAREGKLRQEDIARRIVIDKGAIARAVVRLEDQGLVVRRVSDQCRREKLVALTPDGAELAGWVQEVLNDWNRVSYQGFTPEERALYDSLLTRIVDNVTQFKRGEDADG